MARDLEKRQRVMRRSIALGHCVCDPRLACPCELLKEKDVCHCAGEHLEPAPGPVCLTRLVQKAGCASKIDLATLKEAVQGLPAPDDPRVLLGVAAGDDAGVYRFDGARCLVQTVDVFSPSVDDPYTFGQIAAANSVSDVYAMGGRPLTALSIIGFPAGAVPTSVMRDILRGGLDKMAEAGVSVIGGHSIQDSEIKAGFAVTGEIDADRVTARAGARPGDALVLTKPLGTGILAFAAQIGRAGPDEIAAAAASMAALNNTAAELMLAHGANGCTDVTGFSLLGHLAEMARDSGVDAELVWDDIPLLPGALARAAEGVIPGATERNRAAAGGQVRSAEGLDPVALDVCFDPQTSGGLLIAIPHDRAPALVTALHARGVPAAAVIGRATGKGTGMVTLTTRQERVMPRAAPPPAPPATGATGAETACCAETDAAPPDAARAPGVSGSAIQDTEKRFMAFLQSAGRPKGLDAPAKQAIAVALSVLSKCEPCAVQHIQKARAMGFSQDEIDDAAWSAIAFGGSPVMMFYKAVQAQMDGRQTGD